VAEGFVNVGFLTFWVLLAISLWIAYLSESFCIIKWVVLVS